jgi:hypothetical protein
MSVWLPRSSPTIFARSFTLSLCFARRSLRPFPLPLSSRPVYRFQSTKPSAGPASSPPADPETSSDIKPSPPAPKDVVKLPLSTRVWKKVKHEAAHYWHGSKLLVSEVRISGRLQWKILHGDTLTRRERRQASYILFSKFPGLVTLKLAETDNSRPNTSCALRSFYYRPLYGVPPSSCPQTFPQHAPIHIRRQILGSKLAPVPSQLGNLTTFFRKKSNANSSVYAWTWLNFFRRRSANPV